MSGGMAHSILGASSSKRWMNCPGSVRMSKHQTESRTSEHASLGTAAHELGEKCLLTGKDAKSFKGISLEADGKFFIVDDEMIDAVQIYVDFVREKASENSVEVEKRFNLNWLHPGMFGTNDACISQEFGDLHVLDYKHGAGVPVEVEMNSQLLYYALGAAYDSENKRWRDFENVHVHIIQPRCYHQDGPVRSWTVSMDFLLEFADILKLAAQETEKPDAPLKAGSWCRWCPAAGFCTEIHREAQSVAKTEFGQPLPEVEKLTPDQISKVIQSKSLLTTFISECENYAHSLMVQGKEIPGLKLIRKRSSRVWKDEDLIKRSFGSAFPMEKVFNMKLKTPAQMEKTIGAEAVKEHIVKIEGGITVAPITHRSKAIDLKELDL